MAYATGTQQWRNFDIRQPVRNGVGIALMHYHEFGIATVRIPPGRYELFTQILVRFAT